MTPGWPDSWLGQSWAETSPGFDCLHALGATEVLGEEV